MQYAGIIKNDIAAGEGVNVTFFTQGCPHHCPGCHNPETWDFLGGKEFTPEVLNEIVESLQANGVQRNLSIMGGEPLCPENLFLTHLVISHVKSKMPNIKVYVWTGYIYEDLAKKNDMRLKQIFNEIDYLIDGPFILEQRDITLAMRGSRNQRIINIKEMRENEKREKLKKSQG